MAYENKHVFRDGRIVLYTRNGGGVYHARLSVEGVSDYVVKSTKHRSLDRAREFAEDLYDDLRYKVRHGEEIGTHSFRTIWDRWLKAHQDTLSFHRKRYITGTATRYLLPFLGQKVVGEINDKLIAQYWTWRISYWRSEEGETKIAKASKSRTTAKRPYKQKLGNVAKTPSQKTLDMERTVLGQVLGWAHRNGMINRLPELRPPRIKAGRGVERRPAFELDEWKALYRFLREWAREGSPQDGFAAKKGPHELHRWQRELLRNYVVFMGSSGLRPNEARQLRWCDVTRHQDAKGNAYVVLHIAPDTKTGARECVPLRNVPTLLERIKASSNHTQPDDLVFCNRKGEAVENFGKTFKSVLNKLGMLKSRFGKDRTIYSLRNTYATFRIRYGGIEFDDLASNMGTSPTILFRHYRHIPNPDIADKLGGKLHADQSRKGLYL
ncbi:tyrosine-type recombinase/integrase [Bosea robiniae]|uniref:Phage integrase family protein n=1 Tax=Bosea robiniae TaxID=1036780 RepID=A0ABY0NDK2_9HYPH|nr:tyrosine-type recombinase/integrase [Bosea robiniae]SDF29610.1 Phage integrase family protein [Bosea robiniae]